MNGARHDLLAGAAFAADQDGGIGGSHPRNEPLHLANRGPRADHFVIHRDLGTQAAVLAFQPLDPPHILQNQRRDSADRRQPLQLLGFESRLGVRAVEIDDSPDLLEDHQRHTQRRRDPVPAGRRGRVPIREHRRLFAEHPIDDGAAVFGGTVQILARIPSTYRGKLLAVFSQ